MQLDQRPIKPSKDYLDQLEKIFQPHSKPKEFLRKSLGHIVPCHKRKIQEACKNKKPKSAKSKGNPTKAQIYQKIKKQNAQKYGQNRKKSPIIESKPKQPSKIHPRCITVRYESKDKIQTQEYKKTEDKQADYKPTIKTETTKKQKYEKLLNIMTRQLQTLKEDKRQFEQQAEALHFKKKIQTEPQAPFMKHLKNKTERKKYIVEDDKKQEKTKEEKLTEQRQRSSAVVQAKEAKQSKHPKKSTDGKTNQGIHHPIIFKKQKSQSSKIVNSNAKQKFSIQQIHLLPEFTIHRVWQMVDLDSLLYNHNKYFKEAKSTLQNASSLNSTDCKQSQSNRTKMFDGKKVRQLSNGWIQIWHAGAQRCMVNQNNTYKVVWLRNADVKQYFPNKVISYYCALKKFIQIQYMQNAPIFYYPQLRQLQQQYNMKKQIIIDDKYAGKKKLNQYGCIDRK